MFTLSICLLYDLHFHDSTTSLSFLAKDKQVRSPPIHSAFTSFLLRSPFLSYVNRSRAEASRSKPRIAVPSIFRCSLRVSCWVVLPRRSSRRVADRVVVSFTSSLALIWEAIDVFFARGFSRTGRERSDQVLSKFSALKEGKRRTRCL